MQRSKRFYQRTHRKTGKIWTVYSSIIGSHTSQRLFEANLLAVMTIIGWLANLIFMEPTNGNQKLLPVNIAQGYESLYPRK